MTPTTVIDVISALRVEPGRPRVTWYGDGGERVELSGAVLENWVAKTTNLLVEEFDIAPGARVVVGLPPHWRTVVWSLAVWRAGGCVVTASSPWAREGAAVTVTDSPGPDPQAGDLVVVSLPALARRYDGALPAGAVDAATAVMTYSDALGVVPPLDLTAPALAADGDVVVHRDLVPTSGGADGARVLLDVTDATAWAARLRQVLAVLAAGGSVVLVSGETARALRDEPERRARLVASERITVSE